MVKRRKKMLYHFLVLSHLLSLSLLPHSLHLPPLLLLQEILRITGSLHTYEHQQQSFNQLGEAKWSGVTTCTGPMVGPLMGPIRGPELGGLGPIRA